MQRLCKSCRKWHDLEKPWPEKCRSSQKSNAPYVISDSMEPIKHMGSGRMMDSKANFRRETKATGCIEIGNEPIKPRQPIVLDRGARREAIRRTIYQLRNGQA